MITIAAPYPSQPITINQKKVPPLERDTNDVMAVLDTAISPRALQENARIKSAHDAIQTTSWPRPKGEKELKSRESNELFTAMKKPPVGGRSHLGPACQLGEQQWHS
jgi:hypothetical protein